jgi:hypothetical protein
MSLETRLSRLPVFSSSLVLVLGVVGCDALSSEPEESSMELSLDTVPSSEDAPFKINLYPCCGPDIVEPGDVFPMVASDLRIFYVAVQSLDGVAGNVTFSSTWDRAGGPTLAFSTYGNTGNVWTFTSCDVEQGAHVATVRGTRTDGAVVTTPLAFHIGPGASAPMIADFATAQDGLAFQFTDTSADLDCGFDVDPGAWAWTFGDGTSSTEENPTHTYAAPGNYTVRLRLPRTVQWDRARGILVYAEITKVVTATAP